MKLQEGINDLATTYPDLLLEWCYDKNDVDPRKIYYGSTKVVWWKCPKCKNVYDTSVRIRTGGSNCPYCSGQRVLKGFNDLATWCKNNEKLYLLDEWDFDRNTISPYEVTRGTRKKVWWKCSVCSTSWESPIAGRTKGNGCPDCGKKKIWEVRSKKLIERKGCVFDKYPDLKEEWDYEKNDIDPLTLSFGSGEKVWWKCKNCGFGWESSIVNRAKGKGCPECGKKKIWEVRRKNLLAKKDNIFETNPEFREEWDYERNTINPLVYTSGSHKKAWWKCKTCGFRWESTIARRASGCGCPECGKEEGLLARKKSILLNRGSLYDTNHYCLQEWDYKKNIDLTPKDVTKNSAEKVWWVCSVCGFGWKAAVYTRYGGVGCPRCAKEQQSSFPEQAVYYYVKKEYPDAINGEKTLIDPYELDIYIPSKKIAIEYDGQAYHKSIKKDIMKNDLCKGIGIFLFRIRENECEYMEDTDSLSCFYIEAGNNEELNKVIQNLIKNIKNKCIDVNIDRDYTDIINQYIYKRREDSLANNYPELTKEWDYEKNGNITPEMVSIGSNKLIWWICANAHSYKTSISNRTSKNRGCPYCARKKLLVGFNDFETCYPELSAEWDNEKNDVKPSEVIGGAKKIWWICPKGHSYNASMNSRTNRKSGCPICAGLQVAKGVNDLKTVAPEIAKEWDYEKNGELKPDNVIYGGTKKVWWICPKGHSYDMQICSRKKSGCPICANKRVLVGYNDLESRFPLISKEWDFGKNVLKPSEVAAFSGKKVWWLCPLGHSYCAPIGERTGRGRACPICSNRNVLMGFNDLETWCKNNGREDILVEWSARNEIQPNQISPHNGKKVWWECSLGHEWEASIGSRTGGNQNGCPYCSGRYLLIGYNDLETWCKNNGREDILVEWSNRNEIQPNQISPHNNKKVWWECSLGHVWEASIGSRTGKSSSGCPYCSKTYKKTLIGVNDLVTWCRQNGKCYILDEWDYTDNDDLKPEMFTPGSHKRINWVCNKGHKWSAVIRDRIRQKKKICPLCKKKT